MKAYKILAIAALFAAGQAQAATDPAVLAAGQKAFNACAGCHSVTKGAPDGFGPNLNGVYGKAAGTNSPTYHYSAAMKAYGATWNATTLDAFLTKPQAAVPGTKMPFGGISDPATRAALIAYLKAN